MSNTTEFSVYLENGPAEQVLEYQRQNNLKKSEAASHFIKEGLKHHQNGWLDTLYRDLAMICLTIGVVFAGLFYRGDALGDSMLFYALLFISAAFLSLAADRYDFSVWSLVTKDTTAEGAPRSG